MEIECKECGFVGEMDEFDVAGACPGHLYCNQCNFEIDPSTGKAADYCGECDGCRRLKLSGFFPDTRDMGASDA